MGLFTKNRAYKKGIYTTEIGRSGLQHNAGYPSEEFLSILNGPTGIKTYREMSDNDPIVGGMLFAIKQILRELRWSAKGGSEEDREFLERNMASMEHTWSDFILEISSMFIYGWAIFEQIYHRVGNDVMWRKLPLRSQSSLSRWEIKENGDTIGFWQRPAPKYQEIYLPLYKCIHMRPDHAANNPEGRSILRNAYRPYYFKKNIEELEAIGVERDLVGLPKMTMPEGTKLDDDNDETTTAIDWAKKIITNIRNDEQAGILLPYGWEFDLIGSPGEKMFDTSSIIKRYSVEISVTILAQFIMLGMERTGSYALSKNITDMFYLCIEGWADIIASSINTQAVSTLFALNGKADREIPQIVHTAIRRELLRDVADYVSKLTKEDAMTVTDDLREYLLKYARLESFSEARK